MSNELEDLKYKLKVLEHVHANIILDLTGKMEAMERRNKHAGKVITDLIEYWEGTNTKSLKEIVREAEKVWI